MFGVEPICTVLEIAPSTFYAAKQRRPCRRRLRDRELVVEIRRVFDENYQVCDARKIWRQLNREGTTVARCNVERLMAANGLAGRVRGRRARTTMPADVAARPGDRVERQFRATAPNQLWIADITYVATWSGFAYTAFVTDVFSRRIIGWRTSTTLRADLALDALEMAIWTRSNDDLSGLVHHSDRGVQGGINRSSQHLDDGGVDDGDDEGAAARGAAVSGPVPSPGRPTVAWREDRVRFWAAIARGAMTEDAAVEARVSSPVAFRWFRHAGGVNPCLPPETSGRCLSFAEREEIAILHAQDVGVREIGRRLDRDPSTISREPRRNASTRTWKLEYKASIAQWHAERRARRPKVAKLVRHPELRRYVQDRLSGSVKLDDGNVVGPKGPKFNGKNKPQRGDRRWVQGCSPGQISNWLRTDFAPTSLTTRRCGSATRRSIRRSTSRVAVRSSVSSWRACAPDGPCGFRRRERDERRGRT